MGEGNIIISEEEYRELDEEGRRQYFEDTFFHISDLGIDNKDYFIGRAKRIRPHKNLNYYVYISLFDKDSIREIAFLQDQCFIQYQISRSDDVFLDLAKKGKDELEVFDSNIESINEYINRNTTDINEEMIVLFPIDKLVNIYLEKDKARVPEVSKIFHINSEEFGVNLLELYKKKCQEIAVKEDDVDINIDNIIEKVNVAVEGAISDRKQELTDIENNISDQKDQLSNINLQIEEVNTNLVTLGKQINEDEVNLKEIKKSIAAAKAEYEKYGLIACLDNSQDEKGEPIEGYESYENLIELVNDYLYRVKGLEYDDFTVKSFMHALRTRQMILLWGRPGTGKTSLPMGIGEALGGKCIRIQVQSNWTDNQDTLGFYNVLEKRYAPSQFIDALCEAKKNPGRLYLILMDEMNLSSIEYYFSEMLNFFTWDSEQNEEYTLSLYSKRILERAMQEDKTQLSEMDIYPPMFAVPGNVRIVGTLNTDATTKTLSPKVIDRSFLIELQTKKEELTEKTEKTKNILINKEDGYIDAETFEVKKASKDKELLSAMMVKIKTIRGINEEEVNVNISRRLELYLAQWLGHDDSEITLDELVCGKILPSIDLVFFDDGDDESNLNQKFMESLEKTLTDELPKDCNAIRIIARMKSKAKAIGAFRYLEV